MHGDPLCFDADRPSFLACFLESYGVSMYVVRVHSATAGLLGFFPVNIFFQQPSIVKGNTSSTSSTVYASLSASKGQPLSLSDGFTIHSQVKANHKTFPIDLVLPSMEIELTSFTAAVQLP